MALAGSRLGTRLGAIAVTKGFAVSVYVDDIIISGPTEESLKTWLVDIDDAAKKAGFTWSAAKQDGPANTITAFNINLHNTGIYLQEDRLETFKLAFKASTSDHEKNGIFGYVHSIDAAQADSLKL